MQLLLLLVWLVLLLLAPSPVWSHLSHLSFLHRFSCVSRRSRPNPLNEGAQRPSEATREGGGLLLWLLFPSWKFCLLGLLLPLLPCLLLCRLLLLLQFFASRASRSMIARFFWGSF